MRIRKNWTSSREVPEFFGSAIPPLQFQYSTSTPGVRNELEIEIEAFLRSLQTAAIICSFASEPLKFSRRQAESDRSEKINGHGNRNKVSKKRSAPDVVDPEQLQATTAKKICKTKPVMITHDQKEKVVETTIRNGGGRKSGRYSSNVETGTKECMPPASSMYARRASQNQRAPKLEDPDIESTDVRNCSIPAGWTYRGLAKIAEQNKPLAPGEQCSRTDGRSWWCPLKKQPGFVYCKRHQEMVEIRNKMRREEKEKKMRREEKVKKKSQERRRTQQRRPTFSKGS